MRTSGPETSHSTTERFALSVRSVGLGSASGNGRRIMMPPKPIDEDQCIDIFVLVCQLGFGSLHLCCAVVLLLLFAVSFDCSCHILSSPSALSACKVCTVGANVGMTLGIVLSGQASSNISFLLHWFRENWPSRHPSLRKFNKLSPYSIMKQHLFQLLLCSLKSQGFLSLV